MAVRSVLVNVHANVAPYVAGMNTSAAATGKLAAAQKTMVGQQAAAQASVARTGVASQNMARGIGAAGSAAGGFAGTLGTLTPALIGGAGLVYGLKATVGAAIAWESAFAGVRKTVEGTPEELAAISEGLRDMSKELPTSAEDLAAIAASAGQLGIETDAVLEFTRVIADLGEASNLVGEQGATMLARFANITQMDQSNFDRLGSTIVDLGNNAATTEAEIAEMALRLAGSGSQIGMTEAQILAISAALSSVGIRAEAGGTAFSKVMIDIANAAASGGEELDAFAAVAGMSADAFASLVSSAPADAIVALVEGLGAASDRGENLFEVIEGIGVTEIRMRDALLRSAGAGDLLSESLERGTAAWEENTALADEAAQRYETTEAKASMLWNTIKDGARSFGEDLKPAVDASIDTMLAFADATDETGRKLSLFGESSVTGPEKVAGGFRDLFGLNIAQSLDDIGVSLGILTEAETAAGRAAGDHAATRENARTEADRYVQSLVNMAGEAGTTGGAVAELGDEFGDTAAATEDARTEAERLSDALAGLTEANMSAERANLALLEGFEKLQDTLKENGSTLDENTEKGRTNRTAILEQADAILDAVEADYARDGSMTAVAAKYEDQVGKLRDVMSQAGLTEDQIDDYIETLGLTPEQVVSEIIAETGEAETAIARVAKALGRIPRFTHSTVSVSADLSAYNRAVASVGRGLNVPMADGGILPDQARIQSPGTLIQWAEPETGGEAFIPLAPSKRDRSIDIWRETGHRLGVFADGGATTDLSMAKPISISRAGTTSGPVKVEMPRSLSVTIEGFEGTFVAKVNGAIDGRERRQARQMTQASRAS